MNYLKARLKERSTAFGLGSLIVAGASLLFPEYAFLIQSGAAVLGVGVATVPTGGSHE